MKVVHGPPISYASTTAVIERFTEKNEVTITLEDNGAKEKEMVCRFHLISDAPFLMNEYATRRSRFLSIASKG